MKSRLPVGDVQIESTRYLKKQHAREDGKRACYDLEKPHVEADRCDEGELPDCVLLDKKILSMLNASNVSRVLLAGTENKHGVKQLVIDLGEPKEWHDDYINVMITNRQQPTRKDNVIIVRGFHCGIQGVLIAIDGAHGIVKCSDGDIQIIEMKDLAKM